MFGEKQQSKEQQTEEGESRNREDQKGSREQEENKGRIREKEIREGGASVHHSSTSNERQLAIRRTTPDTTAGASAHHGSRGRAGAMAHHS
jgi:hypothetical protein